MRHRGLGGLALILAVGAVASPPRPLRAQERDGGETARRRAEYFLSQREYPSGRIPPGGYVRALTALRSLPSRPALRVPGAQSSWTSLGPTSIGPGNYVGRVNRLAIDPRNPNTLYIAAAGGGAWKTTDGGGSWTPLTDGECSLPSNSVALDPLNPDIVYVGTGEYDSPSYPGCGLLRSVDGGQTWTNLNPGAFASPWGNGGVSIDRIVVLRGTGTSSSSTLVLATNRGVMRSTDGGTSWSNPLGTDWYYPVTDLVVDPGDSTVLYAVARDPYQAGSTNAGVFKSMNSGATWSRLPNFTLDNGDAFLAITATSPAVLYVSAHRRDGSWAGLWRSDDGGATWNQRSATGLNAPPWYQGLVTVKPDDPSWVLVGSLSPYRSTDGGSSFTKVGADIHVDVRGLTWTSDASTLYVTNDGGVYRTDDLGGSWAILNGDLTVTTFYPGSSIGRGDPSHVLAGSLDNGVNEYTGSKQWARPAGGDGGYSIIDAEVSGTAFSEYQWPYGPIRRQIGGNFQGITTGLDLSDKAQFIPPMVPAPLDPAVLYFGTYRLYRTENRGTSWSPISGDITGGGMLTAIAPSLGDSTVMWVGGSNGKVLRSVDGGETWSDVSAGLADRHVTHIAPDPSDTAVAYVTVSGFGSGHVFKTIDGGRTWTDISGDLPDAPANTVRELPEASMLVVGTDVGLFTAGLDGLTWAADAGLPNVVVSDLALDPPTGTLVATTFGRGAYSISLGPTTLTTSDLTRSDTVAAGDSTAFSDSVSVPLAGATSSHVVWKASSAAPWLTLTRSTGVRYAAVRWSTDPSGLVPGLHVDTVTVSVPGVTGSPMRIVERLAVTGVQLAIARPGHGRDVEVGDVTAVADSEAVTLLGLSTDSVGWSATAGAGGWLSLQTTSGTGSGMLRWTLDPSGLDVGTYVDTITVSAAGALASPSELVDTLRVLPHLGVAATRLGAPDSVPTGAIRVQTDSAAVTPTGFGAAGATWRATHGAAAWLTMVADSGSGPGTARWSVSAAGLPTGVYVDTIAISVDGSTMAPAAVVDSLRIFDLSVDLGCAVGHFLGGTCLPADNARFLDEAGNHNGTYDLGDLLKYLDHNDLPLTSSIISAPAESGRDRSGGKP